MKYRLKSPKERSAFSRRLFKETIPAYWIGSKIIEIRFDLYKVCNQLQIDLFGQFRGLTGNSNRRWDERFLR